MKKTNILFLILKLDKSISSNILVSLVGRIWKYLSKDSNSNLNKRDKFLLKDHNIENSRFSSWELSNQELMGSINNFKSWVKCLKSKIWFFNGDMKFTWIDQQLQKLLQWWTRNLKLQNQKFISYQISKFRII